MTPGDIRKAAGTAGAAAAPASQAAKAASAGRSARVAASAAGEVRIIGGQWKRTRLPVLVKPGLRPTPDRVRETLFNWLGQDMAGWRCLDAFAGTGALGLEAASRHAAQVRMIEADSQLVAQLRQLVSRLGAAAAEVVRGDALAALQSGERWDVVFLDPPFSSSLFEPALKAASAALADGGFIYLEAPAMWGDAQLAPFGLARYRYLKAGAVHAHLLKKHQVISQTLAWRAGAADRADLQRRKPPESAAPAARQGLGDSLEETQE